MPAIAVQSNQRVALVGKTASGKTYFARHLCAPLPRLIVFDPKGTLNTPEWNLGSGGDVIRRLKAGKPGRLRVPAPFNGDWTPYLRLVWSLKNITLYIDEIYGVIEPGHKPPAEFSALYTRGRELGIGVWGATQRPVWVPIFCLSEAEWLFVFRLSMKSDRQRLMEFGDESGMLGNPIRDEHGFMTYNPAWRKPIYTPRYLAPKARKRSA
jgi:hypothetical protein